MQSDVAIAIAGRVFQAIEALKARGDIRGLATIAKECGVPHSSLFRLRRDPAHNAVNPALLAHLVEARGVSAPWLLVGRGPMFAA